MNQISAEAEKGVIVNFLTKIFGKDLAKEGYKEDEIIDFAESYLESFNEQNTVKL